MNESNPSGHLRVLRTIMPRLWKKKIRPFVKIKKVEDEHTIHHAKTLLYAYGAYMYDELQLTAGKESFYYDLVLFPGMKYSPPDGLFYVAFVNREAAGCVGLRKFSEDTCEMKRLFVLPHFREAGIGKMLYQKIIETARHLGYKRILLDTTREMSKAVAMYKKNGFREIPPYCVNENPHPLFMELVL